MTKRPRVRVAWNPIWSAEIESWTSRQIKRNLWKFDRSVDHEDILQEAKLIFFKVGQRYTVINEPAHFFALYKTSLLRFFIDKARIKQKSVIDQGHHDNDEEVINQDRIGEVTNSGHLKLLIEEMPDELKTVLRALTSNRVRLKLNKPIKSLRQRENWNMRLKRRFQLTSSDPVGDLKRYLLNQ